MDRGVVMGREGSVLETGGHGHGVIVLGPTLNALLHTSEEVHCQHCKDLYLVIVNLGPITNHVLSALAIRISNKPYN